MSLYLIFGSIFIIGGVFVAYKKFFQKVSTKEESAPVMDIDEIQILEIQVTKEEQLSVQSSSLAAENLYAALHGLLRENIEDQEHLAFEIAATEDGIKFYTAVPANIRKYVESQIYAQYPHAQIKLAPDYTSNFDTASTFQVRNITLAKETFFPIKSFRDLEIDPLSSLASAMVEKGPEDQIWLQFVVQPTADGWQKTGQSYVSSVRAGKPLGGEESFLMSIWKKFIKEGIYIIINVATFGLYLATEEKAGAAPASTAPKLTPGQELEIRAIENKLSRMGYLVGIRVLVKSDSEQAVESLLRSVFASFKQYTGGGHNSFTMSGPLDNSIELDRYTKRTMVMDSAVIMNIEELATIFHLPTHIEAGSVNWIYSKRAEPPADLPTADCNFIGDTVFRGRKVRFGLSNGDDRLRHMYLIGKSGTGKSTLLESMISQDINNGAGVCVLDPHGETIDKILDRIPDHRVDDVVIIDPSDTERPVGLNLLEIQDQSQKNLMASGFVSAIHQHFEFSWGPRLEYLLNYAILTLLEVPGTTMLSITRLMEDDNYRKYILHFVKDPVIISFWEKEFQQFKGNQKLVSEAIAPIQNKINRFLSSTTMRNILAQKKSTVDIWDIMNNQKILLINLSKGKVGADNANLLGALLVAQIQFMALQRAKIPYEQRMPFYLYVDEFQNFASGSFEEILSESRKYKLGLYLTHQFTAQLPEEMLKAVYGNVGTIATFGVGAPDARVMSSEFAPYFTDEDIISLDKFHIYIRLMVNGMSSKPFSAKILLPWLDETCIVPKTNNKERIIELSRQKYGTDRRSVEDRISKWIETPFDKGTAIAKEARAKKIYEQQLI